MTAEDKPQLRTEEVAELLGLSKSTVINYAKDSLLRVNRTLGRHRRYETASVIELKAALEMDDGPEREARLDGIRKRNRAE